MTNDEVRESASPCPKPLSGAALIAAADGEADPDTLDHLRHCPACAAQVAQLRALQAQLLRRLYRIHCPPTDVLADYCQGLLDPRTHTTVTHHLAICPHCATEVSLMEQGTPLITTGLERRGYYRTIMEISQRSNR